jgi:hypothetical protein
MGSARGQANGSRVGVGVAKAGWVLVRDTTNREGGLLPDGLCEYRTPRR